MPTFRPPQPDTPSRHAPRATGATAPADPAGRFGKPHGGIREQMYAVIFESDTTAGRSFDLVLIATILLSVLVVLLDSVREIAARYGLMLDAFEWFFTFLFTVEYIARLSCVRHPLRYATSFFGIIDLLSIVPAYVALAIPEAHVLLDIRILRLLRMFRILKLTSYVEEYGALGRALMASRRKILIFISFVMMVVMLLGTVMYVVEGPESGFTSIPTSIYWAISAVTTVGFGDIVPKTDIGRTIASMMMLLGWGILAVPTGIISSEMTIERHGMRGLTRTRTCPECLTEGHDIRDRFCSDCGARMRENVKEGDDQH